EFRTFQSVENSLKFENINASGKDELILFPFPYGYVFSQNKGINEVIDYHENINTNSVFTGDLNNNGITEVAFTGSTGTKFYEYASAIAAAIPYNVNGYSIDSTSISLNWEGSGSGFIVYAGEDKNSLTPIDTVITRSFVLSNVVLSKEYFFAIQSIDNSKPVPLSQMSNIIAVYAHTPATVISAKSNNEYSILVTFSDRINNTIENLNSFRIKNLGFANSITAYNQFTYLVTFKERIPEGPQFLLINNLRDFYGSPLKEDSILVDINYTPAIKNLFIVNHQIINPYLIKVEFNLPLNEALAINPDNYILEPDNKPSSIEVDKDNKNVIYIHLNKRPVGAVGVESKLKVQNLFSTNNEPLAEGAGSYIVLIGYAQNLSEVYVYPNPVQANSNKITFAGLPQKSKIDIFNINGMRINSLEESDGNGGIDFNLKDYEGKVLSSGVYIYRIIKLDNSGNEVEEKIGKFAITK
ncbi:MAG: T9SS type A sorting domain-containing protein, partial [Syntrophothermus sp.]